MFSQRYGFVPVRQSLQTDSMDGALRNGIWNVLSWHYWSADTQLPTSLSGSGFYSDLGRSLWRDFFKFSIDTLPSYSDKLIEMIRSWFSTCPWYSVYDLIEFIAGFKQRSLRLSSEARAALNDIMKRELAGYRLVGDYITPVTTNEEVESIESALDLPEPMRSVKIHLISSFEKLANRQNPDYRNSIKESISAVEAMCRIITGDQRATLGSALSAIERNKVLPLHPALREAFNKLYGWTNDAQGIRHAIFESPTIDQEDAKFMLVSCATFINYLVVKSARAGLAF